MTTRIEILKDISENSLPLIKLTKSKNGKTGTATFIFIKPTLFEILNYKNLPIDGIYLVWENKKITSRDIKIIFKKGQPFLLKAIFIFKNNNEWFNFLQFMNSYSKKTGLSFAEN
jgi:photosystem II 13kDa protein